MAVLAYGVFLATSAPKIISEVKSIMLPFPRDAPMQVSPRIQKLQQGCLRAGGLGAILAVVLPVIFDLWRLRPRRIWALARLTFLEVVRMRVLWVFPILCLLFLFPPSWFITIQKEDVASIDIKTAYWIMMVLLWFTFALLAAFGLPTDMQRQTVHTVVTKPVERFEIVLGRLLGYTLLMTMILAVMTGSSLIYIVASGIDPEAAQESFKARQAKYGNLEFRGTRDPKRGFNVGRVWEYRSYIAATPPHHLPQYAVWDFDKLPGSLAGRTQVPCEFSFDVQRMTRGVENKGVLCSLYAISSRCALDAQGNPALTNEYNREKIYLSDWRNLHAAVARSVASFAGPMPCPLVIVNGTDAAFAPNLDYHLARKYGLYEREEFEIIERRTQSIPLPGGLFQNAPATGESLQNQPAFRKDVRPPLQIRVQCKSPTQFIGMARHDLYLRLDDHGPAAEQWLFALNFCKGALGVWFRIFLTIVVAVVLSTYLNSIVSFLGVMFVYLLGCYLPFLVSVMERKNDVRGPAESSIMLLARSLPWRITPR